LTFSLFHWDSDTPIVSAGVSAASPGVFGVVLQLPVTYGTTGNTLPPGLMVTVRTTGGNSPVYLDYIAMACATTTIPLGGVNRYGLTPLWDILTVPAVTASKRYRTLALSILLKNESSEIYRNGNVQGLRLRGGQSPTSLGYLSPSSLANDNSVFTGKLAEGTYGFWYPDDEFDMRFTPFNEEWYSQRPSLFVSADYQIATGATFSYVVEMAMHIESLTQAQGFTLVPSLVKPSLVWKANLTLSRLVQGRSFTKNDVHQQLIKWLTTPATVMAKYRELMLGTNDDQSELRDWISVLAPFLI